MPLSVGLLGPLELLVDGVAVRAGGARERGVLAVLAGSADPVGQDALIDQVWGGSGGSRNTLQVHVHNLRGRLGPYADHLTHASAGYRLAGPALTRDVDRLAALSSTAQDAVAAGDHAQAAQLLRTALGLFRGDYCADLPELAVDALRTAFAENRLALLEDRVEAELRCGAAEVVGELEALVQQHPYRERLWGLLMVALYGAQRQVDALAAYQRAREALLDGAGVDPGEQLRAIERAVLAHQDPTDLLGSSAETGPALLWLDEQGQPRRRALPTSDDLMIGRLDGAHVRLDSDGGVSRRHATIRRAGLGWELHDLGSLNGTTVNEERVAGVVPLTKGDRIRCGSTTLLVSAPSSGRRSPGVGIDLLTTHRLPG